MLTKDEQYLINQLRLELMYANWPKIYAVDNATLCAAEKSIEEDLIALGLEPIITVGKNGVWFKNVELVLKVDKNEPKT